MTLWGKGWGDEATSHRAPRMGRSSQTLKRPGKVPLESQMGMWTSSHLGFRPRASSPRHSSPKRPLGQGATAPMSPSGQRVWTGNLQAEPQASTLGGEEKWGRQRSGETRRERFWKLSKNFHREQRVTCGIVTREMLTE